MHELVFFRAQNPESASLHSRLHVSREYDAGQKVGDVDVDSTFCCRSERGPSAATGGI